MCIKGLYMSAGQADIKEILFVDMTGNNGCFWLLGSINVKSLMNIKTPRSCPESSARTQTKPHIPPASEKLRGCVSL